VAAIERHGPVRSWCSWIGASIETRANSTEKNSPRENQARAPQIQAASTFSAV
jgi:hypothetical protein